MKKAVINFSIFSLVLLILLSFFSTDFIVKKNKFHKISPLKIVICLDANGNALGLRNDTALLDNLSTECASTLDANQENMARYNLAGNNSNNTTTSSNSPTTPTKSFSASVIALAKSYETSPLDLLPAKRWSTLGMSSSPMGWREMITKISSIPGQGIAELTFLLSNLIWGILIYVINLATTANFVNTMAGAIDKGFYSFAQLIFGSDIKQFDGFILILIAIFLITVLKATSSGKAGGNTFRIILTFIIPISTLYGIAIITQPVATKYAIDETESAYCDKAVVGTPSWLGCFGTSLVDDLATTLATSRPVMNITSLDNGGNNKAPGKYTCDAYMATLHDAYNYLSSKSKMPTEGAPKDKRASNITALVSQLWEKTFLVSWTSANFGSSDLRNYNATCHYLESRNLVPATEQAQISAIAYGAFSDKKWYDFNNAALMRGNFIYPWIACQGTGDEIEKAYLKLWSVWDGGNKNIKCDDWIKGVGFIDKDGPNFLKFDKSDKVQNALNDATNTGTAQEIKAIKGVAGTIDTYLNNNSWSRAVLGVFTLISTVLFAIMFGVLALGSFVAQVGLVCLLILLPVSLFLIATPSITKKTYASASNSIGMKMLKLAFGFMTTKILLIFGIVLILLVSNVLLKIVMTIG